MRTKHLAIIVASVALDALIGLGSLLAFPSPASAADNEVVKIAVYPGEPQVRSATPALPFGVRPAESREYVLDFHGYVLLPARLGSHTREEPQPGQSGTVLHSPPLIAQDLRDFEYTGVIPAPWIQ